MPAAAAGENLIDVRGIVEVALNLIVIGQFFAGLNRTDGFDEDASRVAYALAIRIAGMVDVARLIAVDPGIDDGLRIDREQKGVVVLRALLDISRVGLLVADPLAEILDDGRTLANPAQRENPIAVNGRVANLESSAGLCIGFFFMNPQTAIGALIAG